MKTVLFFLILATGIIGLAIYKKISPETFPRYGAWVVFVELLNTFLFWPF